jgi:hypothetical protein
MGIPVFQDGNDGHGYRNMYKHLGVDLESNPLI